MDITYVKAVFGSLRKTRTQPVYRDDHDLILQLVGVKGLPVHFQAHFSNTEYGTAVVMMGSDGEVSIPNTLLATGLPVYCWILVEQGISGAVRYSVQIPVRQKARPDGTIPPEQADIISQAISALNDAGTAAQEAADSAAQSAADAADSAASANADAQTASDTETYVTEQAGIIAETRAYIEENVVGFEDKVSAAISDVEEAGAVQKNLAKAQAENSEAWAVGNRNGSAVPSTDPTYHNNSKYYAEQAAESARTLTIDNTLTKEGQAADSKVVGDKIAGVKAELNNVIDATIDKSKEYDSTDITSTLTIEAGQVNESTGAISGASTYSHTNKIVVEPGFKITTSRVFRRIAAYNGDTLMTSSGTGTSGSEYVVPNDVDGIIISFVSGTNPFDVYLGIPKYTFKYIDEINKVNEMQKRITLTSNNPNATVGENIATAISNWSTVGSSSYSSGVWTLSASGDGVSIPLSSAAEAEGHYLIELTFVAGSVHNGVDKINQLTFTLGDDSTSIFCANDGNFNVVLSPSADVSTLTIVGSGDNFAISINSVSVKKVLAYSDAFMAANINQFRTAGSNFGFGFGLRYMAKGVNNTSLGNRAQEYLDTGIWNTAIGNNAQRRIRNGVGNSAIGNNAEVNITNGCYNNAFGTSALANITSGCWNNGFGNEALRDITTGHNNVAFGRRAMNSLIDGCANIAIGAQAGFYPNPSVHDNNNVFIGIKACRKAASASANNDKAIAIGSYARAGNNGIAIGSANANELPTIAEDNQIKIGNASHTSVVIAGKTITFNPDGTVTWS